jgi:toxin FitB
MFLLDTGIISEMRKGDKANAGVKAFLHAVISEKSDLFLSVITIGEIRQGVERIRHRGDLAQAERLQDWLTRVTGEYGDAIIPFDEDAAHIWGRLRVPNPENPLDKQIAATALLHDLTVVTRNQPQFESTGVRLTNPFT